MNDRCYCFDISSDRAGARADLFISQMLADCSRSRAADLIRRGCVRINDSVKKPGYRLQAGERVSVTLPVPAPAVHRPEAIPLHVLYEDAHLLVVNKPPGMVVHPAPGHAAGTLVNALLYHCRDLGGIGGEIRPGIVHRLDKDTSGTLVVAKTEPVLNHLAAQFKHRKVQKIYRAIVFGQVEKAEGEITLDIGRHPVHRKQMSVRSRRSRTAHTRWVVSRRLSGATLLDVHLMTGRTHQIRVHLAAIGHPIVGDDVYGGRKAGQRLGSLFPGRPCREVVARQMLHAWRLGFEHPETGRKMAFESPLPTDMATVVNLIARAPHQTMVGQDILPEGQS